MPDAADQEAAQSQLQNKWATQEPGDQRGSEYEQGQFQTRGIGLPLQIETERETCSREAGAVPGPAGLAPQGCDRHRRRCEQQVPAIIRIRLMTRVLGRA